MVGQTGANQMVADDRLLGCPYCGFRIDPGEALCPRCGNRFESDTKFECPFCGDLVAPGMDACPSCHIDFGEFRARVKKTTRSDSIDTLLLDIITLEADAVKREEKRLSCPSCDLLLNGSEARCPRCNADLTEGAAFQCPVCGEFVAPESSRCPGCGASFESEEQSDADHEAVSTALDEILTSVGHTGPLPEIERKDVFQPSQTTPPEADIELPPEPEPELSPEPAREREHAPVTAPSGGPKKPRQRKLKTGASGATARRTK